MESVLQEELMDRRLHLAAHCRSGKPHADRVRSHRSSWGMS